MRGRKSSGQQHYWRHLLGRYASVCPRSSLCPPPATRRRGVGARVRTDEGLVDGLPRGAPEDDDGRPGEEDAEEERAHGPLFRVRREKRWGGGDVSRVTASASPNSPFRMVRSFVTHKSRTIAHSARTTVTRSIAMINQDSCMCELSGAVRLRSNGGSANGPTELHLPTCLRCVEHYTSPWEEGGGGSGQGTVGQAGGEGGHQEGSGHPSQAPDHPTCL